MAIHNWVRCHWRNGRHDLHDLPPAWRETLESYLSLERPRAADLGVIRTATVDALELAWVECEVPLGAGESGFSYRRARAIHALVRPTAQGGVWKRPEVESLLGQRYGEPAWRGLAAQHRALATLTYPEDASSALGLFVGRSEPLPSELPARAAEPPTGCEPVADPEPTPFPVRPTAPRRPLAGDVSGPEDWFRRFKLISRAELPAPPPPLDPQRPALDPQAPALDPQRPALDPQAPARPLDGRARPLALAAPEAVEDEAAVPMDQAEVAETVAADGAAAGDESEPDGPALFDLSAPPATRPPAPPSSLSGLLGPSHTSVW